MLKLNTLSLAVITGLSISSFSMPVTASNLDAQILKRLEQMEKRLKALETENAQLKKALNEPYISASEPELTARLKAVESQSNSYRKMAEIAKSLEGIEVSGGLTMVGQHLSGKPQDYDKNDSELNYRGDLEITVPVGNIGTSKGKLFTHLRVGQGLGIENAPYDDGSGGAFSSFNSTSFQRPGSNKSDSTILLAQLWYQLDIPLPLGGNSDYSREHLEMTIGKMDPFMFFDQNAIADDETRGFMNQSFVHNPLLDAGGDIGTDEFGFTPGFRMAWVNEAQKPLQYGLSFGAFGAGKGAEFNDSFSDPFYIIQSETQQRFFSGLEGNYRIYYWKNYSGQDFNKPDKDYSTHAGFGLSIDQKVHDYTTLFARYGQQTQGDVSFDQTLTFGAEFGGSYWSRGGDAIGVALGFLSLSDEYRDANPAMDDGAEQIAELYYRYRINEQIYLSPNVQHIRNPAGDKDASSLTAYGLRAQLDY